MRLALHEGFRILIGGLIITFANAFVLLIRLVVCPFLCLSLPFGTSDSFSFTLPLPLMGCIAGLHKGVELAGRTSHS